MELEIKLRGAKKGEPPPPWWLDRHNAKLFTLRQYLGDGELMVGGEAGHASDHRDR